MKMRIFKTLSITMLVLVSTAIACFAGDGQIDILPNGSETFTITVSGSYVLTDNVTMTADVTCIDVNAHNVTIDLNGHTLTGTESGSGDGINGNLYENLHVFNGMVTKFGGSGVIGYNGAIFHELTATKNGINGIYAGSNACVSNCAARENFKWGIRVGGSGVIRGCSSFNNNEAGDCAGIEVQSKCSVISCVSNDNAYSGTENKNSYGIKAWKFNLIKDNVCVGNNATQSGAFNGGFGISVDEGCSIINNVCTDNVGSGQYTVAIGINATNACVISGNTCFRNQSHGDAGNAYGIYCIDGCTVIDNVCRDNSSTHVSGGEAIGVQAGDNCVIRGNTCDGQETESGYSGIGIAAENGCRIEKNLCNDNQGAGSNSSGIYLPPVSQKSSIIDNTTHHNAAGIRLSEGDHYCGENICSDGIVETSGATLGTGDRSNVTY